MNQLLNVEISFRCEGNLVDYWYCSTINTDLPTGSITDAEMLRSPTVLVVTTPLSQCHVSLYP